MAELATMSAPSFQGVRSCGRPTLQSNGRLTPPCRGRDDLVNPHVALTDGLVAPAILQADLVVKRHPEAPGSRVRRQRLGSLPDAEEPIAGP